jgi:acetyl-CoA carboxylase biotin carboxyl carrier protein
MSDAALPVLWARLEIEPAGEQRILSPSVGWWIDPPAAGALVGAGGALGQLVCLGRRYRLLAPEGTAGRVAGERRARTVLPVEYGELLLRLAPIGELQETRASGAGSGLDPRTQGTLAIHAPSDGVFYTAPAPGAAPYVRPGDRVRRGQAIGIVEVMKTFHQLTYAGAGFPDEAEVVEVRAPSGADVRAGDLLFLFR